MGFVDSNDLEWRVRERLREIIHRDRVDYLRFALTVVLLTPVFLTVAIVVFVVVAPLAGAPRWLEGPNSVVFAVSVAAGGMLVALLLGQQPDTHKDPTAPLLGAGLAYGAILALGYGTPWMQSQPVAFWSLIALLLTAILAFLGWLYEPSDRYYLGWVAGPIVMDDPFTLEDDVDRRHIALGFAVAIPRMILGTYGEIFGSGWLLRPLDEREQELASLALLEAERGMTSQTLGELAGLERRRAARAIRALSKLGLLHGRRGLKLTADGRDLVGTAHGLRG